MRSYWSNNEQNNLEHVESVLKFFLIRFVHYQTSHEGKRKSKSLPPLIKCMTLTEQNFLPLSLVGHKQLWRQMDGFVLWQWTVRSWQALSSPCSRPKPSLWMMPEQWVSGRSPSDISLPDTGLKLNSWATGSSLFHALKCSILKQQRLSLYWYIIPAAQFSDRLTANSQAKFTTTQFTPTHMPLPTTFFT